MSLQQSTSTWSMKTARHTFSSDQLRTLCNCVKKDEHLRNLHEVITLMSNTGIRAGELRDLRWVDVDVLGSRLVVNAGSAYMRSVLFGPKTLQILEARRAREPKTEYVLGKSPRALLACISRDLRIVCDATGISRVNLHDFRISFFERLVLSGASYHSFMILRGSRMPYLPTKNIVSLDKLFKMASLDQAQVEEE
jgi:integrase